MPRHYLAHNLNTTTPSNHVVVDVLLRDAPTEANGKHIIRPLDLWSGRAFRWYKGEESRIATMQGELAETFWVWAMRRLDFARPLWIWTHSAGKSVTALKLWDRMDQGQIELDEPYWRFEKRVAANPRAKRRKGFIADADPPSILKLWASGGQQLQIVDILNWYRQSIEQLAHEMDIDFSDDCWRHATDAMTRCHGSERLHVMTTTVQGLLLAVHQHDMGVMQTTGPAQAMSCFRHRFIDQQMLVHDNADVKSLERSCYYGGRVEPFFIGLIRRCDANCPLDAPEHRQGGVLGTPGPIYHLDVSGLYPHVMRVKDLPVVLQCAPEKDVHPHRPEAHAVRRWCAEVTVESKTTPYQRREDDQTVWATGRFRTFLCGPELERAWRNGHIKAFHYVTAYSLQVCFTRYVDYWHSVRQLADDAGDLHAARLAKLMLVALSGKFAQRLRPWITCLGKRPRQRWGSYAERCHEGHPYQLYRGIGGTCQVRTEMEDGTNGMPAVSAFITAYGRIIMDELREIAGQRQVYYQATDGLYVSETGYHRLVAADEVQDRQLGRLRLVGTADYMRIYGVNDYVFGDRVVRAGLTIAPGTLANADVVQERSYQLPAYLGEGPAAQVVSWTETISGHDPQSRGVLEPDGWITPYTRIEEAPCHETVPF